MEAKRIPGKPGRTKTQKVNDLHRHWVGSMGTVVNLKSVLDILDSPDEPSEPDMIQVTMTKSELFDLRALLITNPAYTAYVFIKATDGIR